MSERPFFAAHIGITANRAGKEDKATVLAIGYSYIRVIRMSGCENNLLFLSNYATHKTDLAVGKTVRLTAFRGAFKNRFGVTVSRNRHLRGCYNTANGAYHTGSKSCLGTGCGSTHNHLVLMTRSRFQNCRTSCAFYVFHTSRSLSVRIVTQSTLTHFTTNDAVLCLCAGRTFCGMIDVTVGRGKYFVTGGAIPRSGAGRPNVCVTQRSLVSISTHGAMFTFCTSCMFQIGSMFFLFLSLVEITGSAYAAGIMNSSTLSAACFPNGFYIAVFCGIFKRVSADNTIFGFNTAYLIHIRGVFCKRKNFLIRRNIYPTNRTVYVCSNKAFNRAGRLSLTCHIGFSCGVSGSIQRFYVGASRAANLAGVEILYPTTIGATRQRLINHTTAFVVSQCRNSFGCARNFLFTYGTVNNCIVATVCGAGNCNLVFDGCFPSGVTECRDFDLLYINRAAIVSTITALGISGGGAGRIYRI